MSKSKIDTTLVELQTTLNTVRSNAPVLKLDTLLPFRELDRREYATAEGQMERRKDQRLRQLFPDWSGWRRSEGR